MAYDNPVSRARSLRPVIQQCSGYFFTDTHFVDEGVYSWLKG